MQFNFKPFDFLIIFFLIVNYFKTTSNCDLSKCASGYSSYVIPNSRSALNNPFKQRDVFLERKKKEETKTETNFCDFFLFYQTCLRNFAKSCRGNLEYHSLNTLVQSNIHLNNCSINGFKNRFNQNKSIQATPFSVKIEKKKKKEEINKKNEKQYLNCAKAALNYTLHFDYLNEFKIFQRKKKLEESEKNFKSIKRNNRIKKIKKRHERNESDSNLDNISNFTEFSQFNSSLTCIIFGDPHLRTLDGHFETCKCQGAWPLIDHPLFAVQITNSRNIKHFHLNSFTSITKLTLLIKKFEPCNIPQDIYYEADTNFFLKDESDHTLPVTFTDESTSINDNLIFISINSKQSISIHLNHIGVSLNISRFSNSFLNVAIVFNKMKDSKIEKAIIQKLDAYSLCVNGCPRREKLNIFKLLKDKLLEEKLEPLFNLINSNQDNEKKKELKVKILTDLAFENQSLDLNRINDCFNLIGYYRISCFYDYFLKGIKNSPDFCKFAQNIDYNLNNFNQKVDFNLFDFKSAKIKSSPNFFIIFLLLISRFVKFDYFFKHY